MLVDLESEHHPAAPVAAGRSSRNWQTGSVALLRFAGVELLAGDPVTLKQTESLLADLASRFGRMGEILSDRVRVEHDPETTSAHGSSSVGRSPKNSSNSAAVAGRPGPAGNTDE